MNHRSSGPGPRVVLVGMNLDPQGRSPDELLGGAWRDFGRSAAAAEQAGARVTVLQAASADAEREVRGVRCSFVCGPRQRVLARIAALAPEVIHYEGLILPRAVRAIARALPRVPILAQDHATQCPSRIRRWWYRWGFSPLAGVTFTAHAQAMPFKKSRVLRRDLPVFEVVEQSSDFTPGPVASARAVTGVDGDPCLVWAGHLDENKDPLTALEAVGRAAEVLPNVKLHMYFQSAPLRAAVESRMAQDPRLAGRVRLAGAAPRRRMEAVYRSADFLLQASHREGSGVALIEALACGVTPIVTDIPSFRRLTGAGQAGALVPVGDSAGLAAALIEWSSRDRAALRRRAREHFQQELSWQAMGQQLRTAYDALGPART